MKYELDDAICNYVISTDQSQ